MRSRRPSQRQDAGRNGGQEGNGGQYQEPPLATARLSFLDWRTWDRSVRAVNAAIPFLRPQQNFTALAIIEPLASIGRHRLGLNMVTFWTCDCGLKDCSVRLRRHSTRPVITKKKAMKGKILSSREHSQSHLKGQRYPTYRSILA